MNVQQVGTVWALLLGASVAGCSVLSSSVAGTAHYDAAELAPVGPRAVGPLVERGRWAVQGTLHNAALVDAGSDGAQHPNSAEVLVAYGVQDALEVGARARLPLPTGSSLAEGWAVEPALDPGVEVGLSARTALPNGSPVQATFGVHAGASLTPVRRTIDASVEETWSNPCWGFEDSCGETTSGYDYHDVSYQHIPVLQAGGQVGLMWTVVPTVQVEAGALLQTDTTWKQSESFANSCTGSGALCLQGTINGLSASVTYRPQAVPFVAATWRLGDLFVSGQVFTTVQDETTQVALGGAATAKWQF